MTSLTSLFASPTIVGWVTDPAPTDNQVKAGWTAFVIFLLLIAATVVLCLSFVRQLRKVTAAKDAGLYGDEPVDGEVDEPEASAQR